MTTDKDILQKLFKIAENQQKIITKLAQIAAPIPVSAPPVAKVPLLETDLKLAPLQNLLNDFVKSRNPAAVNKIKITQAKLKGENGQATLIIAYPKDMENLYESVSTPLTAALTQIPLEDVVGNKYRATSANLINTPV